MKASDCDRVDGFGRRKNAAQMCIRVNRTHNSRAQIGRRKMSYFSTSNIQLDFRAIVSGAYQENDSIPPRKPVDHASKRTYRSIKGTAWITDGKIQDANRWCHRWSRAFTLI
jgi:hypothetical protein